MPLKEAEPFPDNQPNDEAHKVDDLAWATVDELWNELASRHKSCVIIFDELKKTKQMTVPGVIWSGGFSACLGLIITGKAMFERMTQDDIIEWHRECFPEKYPSPNDDENDDADV